MKVELLESREIHRGFFRLTRTRLRYERFDGQMSREVELESVERGDGVAVLPYDPRRDRVMLIRQFRLPPHLRGESGWCLEIPAGSCHPGSAPEQEGRREVLEETGLAIQSLLPMHTFYPSPSGSAEKVHLYLGLAEIGEDSPPPRGMEEEGEEIAPLSLAFDQAWERVANGGINSAIGLLALQWLAMNREQVRREHS